MSVGHVFRQDAGNVGDWHCPPLRYFPFADTVAADILDLDFERLGRHVVVGGGGLLAKSFHASMQRLADGRGRFDSLVAWGVGESENVDRKGGFVLPFAGPMPDYLRQFDLVGVRDYGTEYRWVPCASCMLPQFDRPSEATDDIVIYEHKRIPIPIEGVFRRRSNDGNDIDAVLGFLASGRVVITNSYHGAYWATLLGRRVVALANMSKMYRFKHAPVICRAEGWKRCVDLTVDYPGALAECRQANVDFQRDVMRLQSR
jgi:hypothetical protein